MTINHVKPGEQSDPETSLTLNICTSDNGWEPYTLCYIPTSDEPK